MRKLVVLSVSLVAACRGSDSKNNVDSGNNGSGDSGNGQIRIYDVQNDAMPPGTAVDLHGVVVTAIDNYGAKVGDIWVQEKEGGPFSGVHVFGAPPAQVGQLQVGDVVDITGAVKDEFALTSDTSGRTVTELKAAAGGMLSITKTGETMTIAPTPVDALAIGQMEASARDMEWEKWEGVLITVNNVSALNAPACVGSACNDMTLQNFDITGVAVAESSLAAFPMIAKGDCLGSITGVVDYFFDYLVLPRTTAEVATGGTACPPPENTMALCGDSIDNDANGFSDCQDNACVLGSATCHPTTTIPALEMTTPMGGIEVQNAVVAAISFNKKNIWIQTDTTAAANNGVLVFGPGNDLSGFAVGSRVNVIGTVQEFNNDAMGSTLTEIKALQVTAGTGTTAPPVPVVGQSVATLTQAATGEPYEGVLVTLSNVKVATLGTSTNFYVADLVQGGVTFKADDDILRLTSTNAPVNSCFTTITGIWTYLPFNDVYGFLPITLGATQPVGNCP